MKKAVHIILMCVLAFAMVEVKAQDSLYVVQLADSLLSVQQTDSVVEVDFEGLDSAFVQQLRIREAANQLLDAYSEMKLREEKRMQPDGIFMLLRGSISFFTEKGFARQPGLYPVSNSMTNRLDYIPAFTPLAATWIMKAAGVESRSKIQRMLVANAMAYALTVGVTEGLKAGVKAERPNGEAHSFPSGHAALAFASATILDREYGHVSPWISVGGYVCATGTQLLRIKHNSHWLSDLMVGAGIGSVCTNFAYFLTDKIFGNNGINRQEMRRRDLTRVLKFMRRPTGFHFITGSEMGDRTIHFTEEGYDIKFNSTFCSAVEFNYFFDESWALDAHLRAGTSYAKYYPTTADPSLPQFQNAGQMDIYHADLAGRYSFLLSSKMRFALRGLAGARYNTSCMELRSAVNPELGAGFNIETLTNKDYIFGVQFDYTHTFANFMRNRYYVGTTMKVMI